MIIRQNSPDIMAVGTTADTSVCGTGEFASIVWSCYGPDFGPLAPGVAVEIYDALALRITPCGIGDGPWLDIREYRKTGERRPLDLSDEELVLLGEWLVPQNPDRHEWRYRTTTWREGVK